MYGIMNAPDTPTLSEDHEFANLVKLANEYGLTVITVGADCDMESSLMKRIAQSGVFTIRQQYQPSRPKEFKHHSNQHGPRNRWGGLK